MLEVKNISKTYNTGGFKQVALNKVSLNFRNSEFVSILGPSGSGKTTLLNIIGGLDSYDSGDLIINSISTKKYKSKDWDSYRNHSVGFVFQSYNLIPHQTILSNVELALTISGVSKKERRERALQALDEVGLKNQAHKKPNQMSGGQMQRVAVARALVNDPDILLADEPTGALDSETSIQVMNLLKEIAAKRLVIMVTHNPELAEEYSTRIVRLKDGVIIDDSNPYKVTKKSKVEEYKNLGKSSMSIGTAFGLSLNNLLTKKGRTILTSFAGSIGIIGIALILSLSDGFQRYIDKIQEDMLVSYPLSIERDTADTTSLLMSTMSQDDEKGDKDVVETKNLEKMFSSVGRNDMKSFKNYLVERESKVKNMTTYVGYGYSVVPNIYTKNINGEVFGVNPSSVMSTLMGGMGSGSGAMGMNMNLFQELTGSDEMIHDTYEIIKGRYPESYDEVVVVLPDDGHVSDLFLYVLGLKDSSKLNEMLTKIMAGEKIEDSGSNKEFTYDELLNLDLRLINSADKYRYNANYNLYEDMSEDKDYMNNLYNDSVKLKVVGILKLADSESMSSLMSGIGYTKDLTKYVIDRASEKEIVQKQLNNKLINVFSGKSFDDDSNSTGINFDELITVDTNMLSSAFNININEGDIRNLTSGYMEDINNAITADTREANDLFKSTLNDIFVGLLTDYVKNNDIGGLGVANIKASQIDGVVDEYFSREDVTSKLSILEAKYIIPVDVYKTTYSEVIKMTLKSYVMMMDNSSEDPTGIIADASITDFVNASINNDGVNTMADEFSRNMVEATMKSTILMKVGELTGQLMGQISTAFNVDQERIAGAFNFNLTEDDIVRIFSAMSNTDIMDASTNLTNLGYQDLDEPSRISFYFKDFDSKEKFVDFISKYNKKQEKEDKEKVIEYTDITSIMISSVKVIVDSVSYVLIAFVSISLIVSSIMIGIITYISVLERTKEIGILRAIGASKKNISSIFNAETFIVGFLSGLFGVIISYLLLFPINSIIHSVTNNYNITAYLPITAVVILIILSTVLTLIGGLIPSRTASKQNPVLALRSE